MEHFPLLNLPVSLIVNVLQKTTLVSFTRLRRSSKILDEIAEKHRKFIGIRIYQIDICPKLPDHVRQDAWKKGVIEKFQKTLSYTSPDQVILKICGTSDILNVTHIPLSEASAKLSGISFEKVYAGTQLLRPDISFMEPEVLSVYMEFLRNQRWSTGAATSNHTPMEVLEIIRPKILRIGDYDLTRVPKSVETVEAGYLVDGILPNFKVIPKSVTNFLVNALACVGDDYCLPSLIKDTVELFHYNELPVSYVQLKEVYYYDIKYMQLEDPDDATIARKLLKRYLPLDDSQIVSDADSYYDDFGQYVLKKRITTANTIITSHSGAKGLLALRTVAEFYKGRVPARFLQDFNFRFHRVQVQIFFWKDQLQPLTATADYFGRQHAVIF